MTLSELCERYKLTPEECAMAMIYLGMIRLLARRGHK